MDMVHNSNQVNSLFFFPFVAWETGNVMGRTWGLLWSRPLWLNERRIQATFLIELFCVCFSTWLFLFSLTWDNQWGWNPFLPFFPVQMSDIKEMNSVRSVCMCAPKYVFSEKKKKRSPLSFCPTHRHKETWRGERVLWISWWCVSVCVCYWPPSVAWS